MTDFSALGLAEPLRRALHAANYTVPTPIQAQAIPLLLAGKDLLGVAQTGTGKTAAFGLPLLQRLAEARTRPQPRAPRALILAPTRELAGQIGRTLQTYAAHLPLRMAVIFGGVGQLPQVRALARGVDLLIATPGRLVDLMGQGHVGLGSVRFLVLDEADRMLDMGFVHAVRKIVQHMPDERQSLLFSATMPPEVTRLSAELLRDPVRVEIAAETVTTDRIEQRVFHVETAEKRALLASLLQAPELSRVIVFTRTKHGADRLATQLDRSGFSTAAIHGNKTQGARERALEDFRSGRARVLVATDVAARGIDVRDISHVVNFELPHEPETYVHRIGRTARAGTDGIALSFCDVSERPFLRDIERLTRQPLAATEHELARLEAPAPAPQPRPKPLGQQTRRGSGGWHGKPPAGRGASGKAHAAKPGAPAGKRPRNRPPIRNVAAGG